MDPSKRDKLFFPCFTHENMRFVLPDPFVTSVPTAQQRSGDFSQTYYAAGALQTVFDPCSTQSGPNGNLIRDPFPGNIIPASSINPVAAKVLSIIPLGNVPGNPASRLINLISNGSSKNSPISSLNTTAAWTPHFRQDSMFVRYSRNANIIPLPPASTLSRRRS